jgi:aspartyl-tRNA(Asn)/glutamyl-tRNA(Gln) amidotransferase subunit B
VGGKIAPISVFERKNYFYPDLPKGYQVSQYAQPVVSGGSIAIVVDGAEKTVRLTRAHLEEDAGKLLHEQFHGMSGVDLNRAGTPLLEIVSEPDMRSAAEAVAYAKALHSLVRWIGICDGNMQEGSFRCDANVSVRRAGGPLGTRCEIKNLNSFRFLEKAIEFEVRRQVELIEEGGKVTQETRLFDPDRGETRPMRSKEDAHDYRYFPDPDLLPLEITAQWIEEVTRSLGKLPAQVRREYEAQGVNAGIAAVLTESPANSQFVAATTNATRAPLPLVANWIAVELMSLANEKNVELSALPVTPQRFGKLLDRIVDGTVSAKAAKRVLFAIAQDGGEPDDVIERLGLRQISDSGALEAAVEKVIAANAKLVDDYRAGKEKAFNALVGQVMKATQGKANPAQVNEILRRRLAAAAR